MTLTVPLQFPLALATGATFMVQDQVASAERMAALAMNFGCIQRSNSVGPIMCVSQMCCSTLEQLKICWRRIQLIAVPMVNYLVRKKPPTQFIFHHKPVYQQIASFPVSNLVGSRVATIIEVNTDAEQRSQMRKLPDFLLNLKTKPFRRADFQSRKRTALSVPSVLVGLTQGRIAVRHGSQGIK